MSMGQKNKNKQMKTEMGLVFSNYTLIIVLKMVLK